ncbi:MAG: hypothetical protein QXK37_05410 [Candidatus Woesearchaeota archaeon]
MVKIIRSTMFVTAILIMLAVVPVSAYGTMTKNDEILMQVVNSECRGCLDICNECRGPCGEIKGPKGRVWFERECPETTSDGKYFCYCDESEPWKWTVGKGRLQRTITAEGTCKKNGVVPEFTTMAAGIALVGAGAGYLLIRRRKQN